MVLALASVALADCTCDEVIGGLPTPEIGILDVDANLHTEADPWLVVNLGDADTGQTASQVIKLKNIGTGRLHINQMCFVNAPDYASAIRADTPCLQGGVPFIFTTAVGQELGPDASADVPITFRPTAGGPASVFLRIASDANAEPLAAVQLVARGTDGTLCADPAVIDFGDVPVGGSKTLPVVVSNCGVKPVTVDGLNLVQNPDNAFDFTLNGAVAAPPIGPVAEGQTFTLEVTFSPTQPVPYRDGRAGDIRVTTAAPFAATYDLILLGNGIEPPSCRVNVVPQAVNFGGVAANSTQTRQVIVQSVGQCACSLTGFAGPTPDNVGFAIPNPPALPVVLKGTTGCDGDPASAAAAPSSVSIDVTYTAPDRPDPQADNATIEVTTDAPVDPVRTVALQANGGGQPFCELAVSPQLSGIFGNLVQGRYGVVEFGRTAIFVEKRQPITLENVGNATCTVSRVEYDKEANTLANEFRLEDPAGNTGITSTAFTIEPGQNRTFFAVFAPTETLQSDNPFDVFSFGSYSGSLGQTSFSCGIGSPSTRCNGVAFITDDLVTDQSDGSDVPGRFSIGFSGTPVEPSVDVIPAELDFGAVTLDCGSPELRTTVYNTGGVDLVVGQPVVDPALTPPLFKVLSTSNPGDSPNDATSGWPFTISPGGSLSISVRYFARDLGLQTGLLVLPTFEADGGNLSEGPPVTVPLQGEGTLERNQVDIFDQPTEPTVDVLFVVDDSGSMSDDQDELAANFPQFFTTSNVAAANYHIAVTTTLTVGNNCVDIGGNANCADHEMSGWYTACSNERFLTPASSNAANQFSCNVQVSDTRNPSRPTSDGGEGGLRGAYNFLSPPNINDPAINGGFLREEAKLHVIMVSDEPDQSRGPTDLYVDFFRNIKGFRNEGLVAVSAIAKRDNERCSTDDDVGSERYEDVVNALNGRFQSLCAQDWSANMRALGLDSLGLQVEFFLTRAATASTLQVCVRTGSTTATCQAVQQTSAGAPNGWFYDASNNSVVFNSGSVPGRGSRVEVRYETFCFQ